MPVSLRQDRVLGYVINSYAGLDEVPGRHGMWRRVWLWEEGQDVVMGNTEAFAAHLKRRFKGLRVDPSMLHALMRELGEQAQHHKTHAPRTGPGGRFRQPAPDQWVVGKKTRGVGR